MAIIPTMLFNIFKVLEINNQEYLNSIFKINIQNVRLHNQRWGSLYNLQIVKLCIIIYNTNILNKDIKL